MTEKWMMTRLDPLHVFHIGTSIVMRTNLDGGNKKKLFVSKSGALNLSGIGHPATPAEFRKKFNNMAGWERVK